MIKESKDSELIMFVPKYVNSSFSEYINSTLSDLKAQYDKTIGLLHDVYSSLTSTIGYMSNLISYATVYERFKMIALTILIAALVLFKSSWIGTMYESRRGFIKSSDLKGLGHVILKILVVNSLTSIVLSGLQIAITNTVTTWHKKINFAIFEIFREPSTLYYNNFADGMSIVIADKLKNALYNIFNTAISIIMSLGDFYTSMIFVYSIPGPVLCVMLVPVAVTFILKIIIQYFSQQSSRDSNEQYSKFIAQSTMLVNDKDHKQLILSQQHNAQHFIDRISGLFDEFTFTRLKYLNISISLETLESIVNYIQEYTTESFLITMVALGQIDMTVMLLIIPGLSNGYMQIIQMISLLSQLPDQIPVLETTCQALETATLKDNSDQLIDKSITSEDICNITDLKCMRQIDGSTMTLWHINKLNIKKTDKVLLKGVTGSGKSSLLYILQGIISSDKSQSIYFEGDACVAKDIIRLAIQNNQMPVGLDGPLESWLAYPKRELEEADKEKASKYLNDLFDDDQFGLDRKLPAKPSGGQTRRLNAFHPIAGTNEKFLLLDETTNEMGDKFASKYLEFISKDPNITGYILSTHNNVDTRFYNKVIVIDANGSVQLMSQADYLSQQVGVNTLSAR